MAIKRAKSVTQLYDECAEYDLVVVPDPPLGSSLSRRLDRAQFGPFAITPRRLAAGHRGTAENRRAFLEVVDRTDLGWKEATYAVENVLECWKQEGTADAILDYDGFNDHATRATVDLTTTPHGSTQQRQRTDGPPTPLRGWVQLEDHPDSEERSGHHQQRLSELARG